MAVGTPERVIDEIVRQGKRGLTVIANDTASPGRGIGKLIGAGAVRKLIASHIGLNPETQQAMMAGNLEVELVPQGKKIALLVHPDRPERERIVETMQTAARARRVHAPRRPPRGRLAADRDRRTTWGSTVPECTVRRSLICRAGAEQSAAMDRARSAARWWS